MRQGPLGGLLCQINRVGWEKLALAVDCRLRPLAALCGAPLWLLQRLFKQRFRQAPIAWMRRLKCRRAGALVRAGQYLKEAAGHSAFGSASDLCHQFTKAWGVSPKRYALGRHRRGG
jgi:AraC-like DNA-binding protein